MERGKIGKEREKEMQKASETDGKRERQRESERGRERKRERQRESERGTERKSEREREREREREKTHLLDNVILASYNRASTSSKGFCCSVLQRVAVGVLHVCCSEMRCGVLQ